MNDRTRSSAWAAGGDAGELRDILDRLPAYYREEAVDLAPGAARAEELLAAARSALRSLEERIAARPFLPSLGPREAGGTTEEVARWLAVRHGVEPSVWNGFAALEHPAGGVELRRSRRPSTVIAWERESVSPRPDGFDLPLRVLPPGVRLDVVVLSKLPVGGSPRAGERVAGEVVFTVDCGGRRS